MFCNIFKQWRTQLTFCYIVMLLLLSLSCSMNSFSNQEVGAGDDVHNHGHSHQHDEIDSGVVIAEVFVALQDIKQGTRLTREIVGFRCFAKHSTPMDAVSEIMTTQFAHIDISQGQIITRAMLTPTSQINLYPPSNRLADLPPLDPPPYLADVMYQIEGIEEEVINIIMTDVDIEQGTLVNADDLRLMCVPINFIPANFVVDKAEVVSQVAQIDLFQTTFMARHFVAPPGQNTEVSGAVVRLKDLIYENQGTRLIDVVVAAQNIELGQSISSPMITTLPQLLEVIPVGFFWEEQEVMGQVAKIDIAQGDVLSHHMLVVAEN